MKMTFKLEMSYELTDDMDERMRIYGTIDSQECAEMDAANSVSDLVNWVGCVPVIVSVGPSEDRL